MSRAALLLVATSSLSMLLACGALPPPHTTLDEQPPRIANAFFGLDHDLPAASFWLCAQGPGLDGLPVTFTRRVVGALDPKAFSVRLRSGAIAHPVCATTRPANAPSENHTVLLIGELGHEPGDPPVSVEVTGPLALEGGMDGQGLTAPVTPLLEGPTLALALDAAPTALATDCPPRTRQVVVALWSGGVSPVVGTSEAQHLAGYEVVTTAGVVKPFALGDVGDNDNYVHLCLDTDAPARRVRCTANVVVDPRGDLNPETSVDVSEAR